ncbi:hypothetical protein TSOC_004280, partial [Tetrabaena socialis]
MPSAAVDWASQLQPHFPSPIASVKARTLQSLWAGYGSVSSLQVQLKGRAQPAAFIVKDVQPPRDTGVGHERKYLDTRREEFGQMGRSWAELREVAEEVDAAIKRPSGAEHTTCIHGDVKNENILFTADGSRCAMYDFQYTGRSYGVRDLVYLFASSVQSSDLLGSKESELLSYYHSELCAQLAAQRGDAGREAAARYDQGVMLRHFELVLLDYVRFMAGWGTWGSGLEWALRRSRALLPAAAQLLAGG